MKTFLASLILIGGSIVGFYPMAHAQVNNDESLDADFDPISSEDVDIEGSSVEKTTGPSLNAGARQNRSIYIVNQTTSAAKSESKAKTDQESINVSDSRASELRKSRQRAELETELKATEKIEEARLRDERRRNEVLFGDRFNDLEKEEHSRRSHQQSSGATMVQTVPVYIQQQPAVKEKHEDKESLIEEIRDLFDKKEQGHGGIGKNPQSVKNYMFLSAGLTEFPKAENIQGSGAFGIGLGAELQDRFLLEGMFQYASYTKHYLTQSDIDEYTGSAALKVQFNHALFRPYAGATAAYSYRTYSDEMGASRQTSSSALDVGMVGGAQFEVNPDFTVGGEFRYLWNLTSKTPDYYAIMYPGEEPLDTFSHYVLALVARFNY